MSYMTKDIRIASLGMVFQVDLVFSRLGVRALGEVVVMDFTNGSNVVVTTYLPGHAAAKASWLKEN